MNTDPTLIVAPPPPSPAEATAEIQLKHAIISASETLLLKKATALAEKYMTRDRRGGGTQLQHCAHVAADLARAGCSTEIVVAGLLHDILEDAGEYVFLFELRRDFGPTVASLVDVLTKFGMEKKHERKYLDRIEAAGKDVVLIKLADNTHNLQGCQHLNHPARYVKYGAKIQEIGCRVLGEDHPFVLKHLRALRSAQAELVNLPA